MSGVAGQLVSAAFGALATALLAALVRLVGLMRKDLKRFMAEHLWLLANADWSRRSITRIMVDLGIDGEPPPEWPAKRP